jgi:hypothetical protein
MRLPFVAFVADETTLLRHASHLHHPHPIDTGRPAFSERVFHLYGPVGAHTSALIPRRHSSLPGATTRGPRAALSPGCYSSPASLPARDAHRIRYPARHPAESAITADFYTTSLSEGGARGATAEALTVTASAYSSDR